MMYKIKCKQDMIYWIRLTFPNTMLKTVMINPQGSNMLVMATGTHIVP